MSEESRPKGRNGGDDAGSLGATAVLGASPKADRYAHMALTRLKNAGHRVIPVNPAYSEIEGIPCVDDVAQAAKSAGSDGLHTLTVYIGPARIGNHIPDIIEAAPKRVVFNPGTESESAQKALDEAGIPWIEACTLVLLSSGQY
jgi:uncharacterized protein